MTTTGLSSGESLTNSARTAEQTTIGLFWTPNPGTPFLSMLAHLVADHSLSPLDSARLYAMVWTGFADGFIGCMDAKYQYSFWRPVTAIRAGGGNPELVADPSWTALAVTPNHPEYPAAHGCGTGALSTIVAGYFGTTEVPLSVTSTYAVPAALGGGLATSDPHIQRHQGAAGGSRSGADLRRNALSPFH